MHVADGGEGADLELAAIAAEIAALVDGETPRPLSPLLRSILLDLADDVDDQLARALVRHTDRALRPATRLEVIAPGAVSGPPAPETREREPSRASAPPKGVDQHG